MSRESYANEATTTLSGAVTAGATSISVASAASFPPSGQFRVRIDNEILLVTSGQGTTTWGVTRAAEDASRFPAASHVSGSLVTMVVTVGGLQNLYYLDVRAFGAKGDGVTDDRAAIQAAIDALPVYSGGRGRGTVFFPAGNYVVGAAVNLATSGINLLGEGQAATIITSSHAGPTFETPDTGATDPVLSHMSIREMRINSQSSSASAYCFRLREFANVLFDHVSFYGSATGAGSTNVAMYRNILVTFRDCDFTSFGSADWACRQGLGLTYNNVMRYYDCSFKSAKGGLQIISGANATIVGCHFETLTGENTSGFAGITWDCFDGGLVASNYFEGISASPMRVEASCGPVQGLAIHGNFFTNYASPGIDAKLLRNSHIGSNVFNPSGAGINANGVDVGNAVATSLVVEPQYLRAGGTGAAVVGLTSSNGVSYPGGYGPFIHGGVPSSTSFDGVAEKGALLIDTTNGTLYQNTGTKTTPTWTAR